MKAGQRHVEGTVLLQGHGLLRRDPRDPGRIGQRKPLAFPLPDKDRPERVGQE